MSDFLLFFFVGALARPVGGAVRVILQGWLLRAVGILIRILSAQQAYQLIG